MIAKERQEQIEKHGRTVARDYAENANQQIVDAATSIIQYNPIYWPNGWDGEVYAKIRKKSRKEQLVIVGALIAAEIDRMQMSQDEWEDHTADDGKLQDM